MPWDVMQVLFAVLLGAALPMALSAQSPTGSGPYFFATPGKYHLTDQAKARKTDHYRIGDLALYYASHAARGSDSLVHRRFFVSYEYDSTERVSQWNELRNINSKNCLSENTYANLQAECPRCDRVCSDVVLRHVACAIPNHPRSQR